MVSFYHVSPGQGEDGAQGGNVGVSSVDFSYTTLFQLCENKMMLFFFFVTKIKRKKTKRAQSASSFTWSRVTISKKGGAQTHAIPKARIACRAAADILNDGVPKKLPKNLRSQVQLIETMSGVISSLFV